MRVNIGQLTCFFYGQTRGTLFGNNMVIIININIIKLKTKWSLLFVYTQR